MLMPKPHFKTLKIITLSRILLAFLFLLFGCVQEKEVGEKTLSKFAEADRAVMNFMLEQFGIEKKSPDLYFEEYVLAVDSVPELDIRMVYPNLVSKRVGPNACVIIQDLRSFDCYFDCRAQLAPALFYGRYPLIENPLGVEGKADSLRVDVDILFRMGVIEEFLNGRFKRGKVSGAELEMLFTFFLEKGEWEKVSEEEAFAALVDRVDRIPGNSQVEKQRILSVLEQKTGKHYFMEKYGAMKLYADCWVNQEGEVFSARVYVIEFTDEPEGADSRYYHKVFLEMI